MNEPQASLAVGQHEAAKLTGLSAKTLERLAARGEPVGRIVVNRRVVFHVATLAAWLERRATAGNPGNPSN